MCFRAMLFGQKCGETSNSLKSHLKLHLQSSLQIEAIIALSENTNGNTLPKSYSYTTIIEVQELSSLSHSIYNKQHPPEV